MEDDMKFKGNDPGAVRYGNFINYYQFNPPENRLSLLSHGIFDGISKAVVLDIGANAGDLTASLQQFLAAEGIKSQILGIDIDPILTERANEKYSTKNIKFACLDIMKSESLEFLKNHLELEGVETFDIIFCFSVTMWIHLNHGDDGLKKFLHLISKLGKMLVIEPQPWKCYKTAVKRLKKNSEAFPMYNHLKITTNVDEFIENYIKKDCNRNLIWKSSNTTKWGRRLLLFK